MARTHEALGHYYVAHYGVPIFYNGTVYWPIIGPDGKLFVTLVGDGISVGPLHDKEMLRSREPADRLVAILNRTVETLDGQ